MFGVSEPDALIIVSIVGGAFTAISAISVAMITSMRKEVRETRSEVGDTKGQVVETRLHNVSDHGEVRAALVRLADQLTELGSKVDRNAARSGERFEKLETTISGMTSDHLRLLERLIPPVMPHPIPQSPPTDAPGAGE